MYSRARATGASYRVLSPTLNRTICMAASLGEAEHVLHRVEPGRPPCHESHRAQGAARERVAAVRPVGQLQTLAQRAERHGVLADHVARAERADGDLASGALARQALPAAP